MQGVQNLALTALARRALAASGPEEVHQIAANRLRESGLLDHPDIGEWLRTAVERAQAPDASRSSAS